jgi:hypothetical protein
VTPEEIIRLKSAQHRKDMARIRELEAQLAAVTKDRDEWRSLVQATGDLRSLLARVATQMQDRIHPVAELAYQRRSVVR